MLVKNLSFSIFLFCIINPIHSRQTNIPNFKIVNKPILKIKKGQEYEFGYLEVLENRKKPKGKTIKLPVYIFKSRNNKAPKDPIIYTVGGPGSSTMPSAQYMQYYKYLDDRDFILIEQRGTFYSKPHLDCPNWSEALYKANLPGISPKESNQILLNAAKGCKEKLVKKKIDLNAYNTNQIAADINDLVKVLKIEQYNLLTISYSTKIAQVLMRDYPEKIRSVVMDSPLPLEVNYDVESNKNLLQAVSKVLKDCELNTDCKNNFENISNRFFDFLKTSNNKPLKIEVKNPKNKKPVTFYLKGKDLINLAIPTHHSDAKEIPLRVQNILNGNYSYIEKKLESLLSNPSSSSGTGMRLSVWCSEELPFVDDKIIYEETNKYESIKGLLPVVYTKELCNIWGVVPADSIENRAIKSNIPTLLISGEYDNETPLTWAQNMQKNLTNSYHVIFEGWVHTPTTNWSNQCAMVIANNFFNNPSKLPSADCLKDVNIKDYKLK